MGLLDLQGKTGPALQCLYRETTLLGSKKFDRSGILFGIYALLRPRRTLRAVELEAQVGSPVVTVLGVVDENLS